MDGDPKTPSRRRAPTTTPEGGASSLFPPPPHPLPEKQRADAEICMYLLEASLSIPGSRVVPERVRVLRWYVAWTRPIRPIRPIRPQTRISSLVVDRRTDRSIVRGGRRTCSRDERISTRYIQSSPLPLARRSRRASRLSVTPRMRSIAADARTTASTTGAAASSFRSMQSLRGHVALAGRIVCDHY